MAKIITISREFGSGGRKIAELTAQKLGYNYYDKEIINSAAEKSGLSKNIINEVGEYASSTNSLLFNLSVSNSLGGGNMSMYDHVFTAQTKVIKQYSDEGNCVILGRCADYILRDREDCLHVFIHADMESRIKRIVEEYKEDTASPEKLLKEKDKRRRVYYKNYTGQNWGDINNYHIVLDSGYIGIEECAEIIARLAKQ